MYARWAPYVPVAARRRAAAFEMARLEKNGHRISPVIVAGRTIATTVWGRAWCDNLEAYSDYANRLPRGRTYVRNGSVIDLQISGGRIEARVSGSSIYHVTVTIAPLARGHWTGLCADCAGGIDSLVELLQGRMAEGVMDRLSRQGDGLFPSPRDIRLACSCPDSASMCKHVAAVLYGIGARLDHEPHLLFVLRQVDAKDLLAEAGAALAREDRKAVGPTLSAQEVGALFGLEMDQVPAASTTPKRVPKSVPKKAPKMAAREAPDPPGRARSAKLISRTIREKTPSPPHVRIRPPPRDIPTRLLALLRRRGTVTSSEAQAALGVGGAAIAPLLRSIVEQGLATTSGRTRGTVYHIVD